MEASKSQNSARSLSPSVLAYHCLCTQLLLASPQPLENSVQRGREALDKAYIIPLAPLELAIPENSSNGGDGGDGSDGTTENSLSSKHGQRSALMNTFVNRKPIIVRRSDGFEPRYQRHCSRCDLVIGYHLDKTQSKGETQTGRDDGTIFILPGALTTTAEMLTKGTSTD